MERSTNRTKTRIMKKLITILAILATMTNFAQDKRFTFGVYTEPNAIVKDGFNFGVEIEYQMHYLYFKAGTFQFPNLNGIGYAGYYGVPIGFNLHSKFSEWRGYTGLQLGFNVREGNPNPTAGIEAGIDRYFREFYIGLIGSYIKRGDAEFYGGNEWVYNVGVKIGIEL